MMRHQWNSVITLEKKEINTTEVAISVRNSACLGHNQGSTSRSKLYLQERHLVLCKQEALNSLYRVEKIEIERISIHIQYLFMTAVQGWLVRAQYCVTASDIL